MSEKKRILVVDDEPDFAAIVQENLEKEGFEVEVAYNGIEGLEKVHANPPDAVVLDVMMPEKDGYAVCKELKADKKIYRYPHHLADGCRVPCDVYPLFPPGRNEHRGGRLHSQAGFCRGNLRKYQKTSRGLMNKRRASPCNR
jgi:hypothetical protein